MPALPEGPAKLKFGDYSLSMPSTWGSKTYFFGTLFFLGYFLNSIDKSRSYFAKINAFRTSQAILALKMLCLVLVCVLLAIAYRHHEF